MVESTYWSRVKVRGNIWTYTYLDMHPWTILGHCQKKTGSSNIVRSPILGLSGLKENRKTRWGNREEEEEEEEKEEEEEGKEKKKKKKK